MISFPLCASNATTECFQTQMPGERRLVFVLLTEVEVVDQQAANGLSANITKVWL